MSHALTADDVEAITREIWASFAGESTDEPLDGATTPDGTPEPPLRSTVDIQGAWNGRIMLELSTASATAVTAKMLGQDPVTRSDVRDAAGELANMVGGNIKSLMPTPSRLGLPTVTWPDEAQTSPPNDRPELLTAELHWAGESIRILVWDLDAPHKEAETS